MPSPWPLYRYRGKVTRVIDGDTAVVLVDFGMRVYHEARIRIKGINAPEIVGENRAAAFIAKAELTRLIEGRVVYLRTHNDSQSFNRYVADVFLSDGENVADLMVAGGYAEQV
jgi:endonuclease YncB( thermonuclease family)